jgi:hypothetical protein
MSLEERIFSIIDEVCELREKCFPGFCLPIEYLVIFAQSAEDFNKVRTELQKNGEESEAHHGYSYQLRKSFEHNGEVVYSVRLRRPDVHRKELGCADLKYKENDYSGLRNIALDKGWDIIVRKEYEMIELSDFEINVYAYLVK